jgi:hypothetical protein
VFVDPRGELAMPPHYDAAKLHKAVTGGYDLIHYGGYSVSVTAEDGDVRIELSVDHAFDAHYRAGLDALLAAVPVFAAAEEVTEGAFVRATLGAAFAHQVSFSWYHAHHPAGIDTPRVIAYLAVASLMARRLLAHGPENPPSLDQQLL